MPAVTMLQAKRRHVAALPKQNGRAHFGARPLRINLNCRLELLLHPDVPELVSDRVSDSSQAFSNAPSANTCN